MSGIIAIAIMTFRHCARSRVVLLGIVAYVAAMGLCVLFAPAPASAKVPAAEITDGTAFDAERAALTTAGFKMRFIQSMSLGVAFFFGIAITVVAAATWLPAQIRGGELGPVLSKPVGRASAVLGTFLGFWLLLLVLYAVYVVCGAATLRLTAANSKDPQESNRQLQTMHMAGASRFGENGDDSSAARVLLTSWSQSAVWRFDAQKFTGDDRGAGTFQCQFIGEIQKIDNSFVDHTDLLVSIRDPEGGAVLHEKRINNVKSGKVAEFTLSRRPLPEGEFDIVVSPAVGGYQVVCYRKGLGVITATSGFEWNYLKTFGLSLAGLTVFLALTILGSTLLTSNVSIFFSAGMGVAGACMNFLREYVETRYIPVPLSAPAGPEGIHPFLTHLRTAAGAFGESASAAILQTTTDVIETVTFGVIPDWSRFDSMDAVLNRVSVSAKMFGSSLIYASVYCAVCIILAAILFGRRELK